MTELKLEELKKYQDYWEPSHQWLQDFVNKNDLKIGAEIGVAFGSNLKGLLDNTSVEKLYGIDPYDPETWDLSGFINVEKEFGGFDNLHETVVAFLSSYKSRVKLVKNHSKEAAKKIKNKSLDFVFIDGDHTDIETDVLAWEPKVRDGGYIMGHDWAHPSFGNITEFLLDYYGEDVLVGIESPVHIWYVKLDVE
jgi:hypothetical protein